MSEYIKLKDLAKYLHINRGDNIFVTSDVKELLYDLMTHDDDTDLNILIDGIIDIIGEEGTLVFPTFNWDFCKGVPFDIKNNRHCFAFYYWHCFVFGITCSFCSGKI